MRGLRGAYEGPMRGLRGAYEGCSVSAAALLRQPNSEQSQAAPCGAIPSAVLAFTTACPSHGMPHLSQPCHNCLSQPWHATPVPAMPCHTCPSHACPSHATTACPSHATTACPSHACHSHGSRMG